MLFMTSSIIDIKFRSKFRNQMNFSDLSSFNEFKEVFFIAICSYEEFFIGLLWSLTYNPIGDKAPEKYLYFYKTFNRFSTQQQAVILSELRYQYALLHPDFLKVEVEGNIAKRYAELKDFAGEITAYQVLQKCMQFKKYQANVRKRCSELLKNSRENFYFGGIRELGFKHSEASYLKSYIKQISNLFDEVAGEVDATHIESTYKHNNTQSTQVESPSKLEEPLVLRVDASSVSKHHELFKKFLECLGEFENLGLDISEAIQKREQIAQLLKTFSCF